MSAFFFHQDVEIMKASSSLFAVLFLSLTGSIAFGQNEPPTPRLISVFPVGGKAGSSIDVKIIEQTELEFADGLVFSHPGIVAQPKKRETNRFYPDSGIVRNEFVVTIANNVPPGIYEVRGKCEFGISNPRRFVVSRADEVQEVEPNDSFEQATEVTTESVANGLFESGYDYYKVKVTPGQSLVFRCVAEQIDSNGDPVIAIFDSNEKMIGKNHDLAGKDSLVSFQADKEEVIYIRVNDLTFTSQGGAGTTPYRLVVSSAPWIDFVDPPVIPRGQDVRVRLTGRNLGGGQSGIFKDGFELETIEVTVNSAKLEQDSSNRYADMCLAPSSYSSNQVVYRLSNSKGISNAMVFELCDGPVVKEDAAKKELKLGNEVLGVFSKPGEVDSYQFSAKKGERFWIEVVSQRLGIDTDPLLTIESITKDKDGKATYRSIRSEDDLKPMQQSAFRFRLDSEDPATLFEAPSDGDFRISIVDQFNLPANQNGPNYYKLIFRRPGNHVDLVAVAGLPCGQNDNHARPLKVYPCIVRPNSGAEIQVFAYRSPGFDSPISLSVENLPQGVTAHPSVINGNSSHGTIVLTGSSDLKPAYASVRIVASYVLDGKTVTLPVAGAEVVSNGVGNEPSESRLTDELYVISDSHIPSPGTIELSQETFETAIGGIVETKAKLAKHPEHKGAILQGYVHGLPRTVTRPSNTIPDDGKTVDYKIDFRQGSLPGEYSTFIRGYFDKNTAGYKDKLKEVTDEQKRIGEVIQKLETEYRNATREKQTLTTKVTQQKQKQSQLAAQNRTAKQQLDTAARELAAAEKAKVQAAKEVKTMTDSVASVTELMKSEKDAAKKQKLQTDLNAKLQQKATAENKLATADQSVANAKSKMTNAQNGHEKILADEKQLQQEMEQTQTELAAKTELESKLAGERTLGQNVKREVDAELNIARNASRDRQCRFLVYSKPIHITVAEYPVEMTVSKKDFVLEQGQSEKIMINLKRLFDFKGPVTVQLRPGSGANGWGFKKDVQLNDGMSQAEAEITVQNFAKPGKFSGEFRATMRNGSANLTLDIPVTFEVKAAPKKK